MVANVKGGLLDRILKARAGGELRISPAESLLIAEALFQHASGANGAGETIAKIQRGEPFQFLGVTIKIR